MLGRRKLPRVVVLALAGCAPVPKSARPADMAKFADCPKQRYVEPIGSSTPMLMRFEDAAAHVDIDAICVSVDEAGTVLRGVRSAAVDTGGTVDQPLRLLPGRHRLRLRVVGHALGAPSNRVIEVSSRVIDVTESLASVTATLRDRGTAKDAFIVWSTQLDHPGNE